MKPRRPKPLIITCARDLYLHFQRIFLNNNPTKNTVISECGDRITILDYHFFHMVKLQIEDKNKLVIDEEKELILACAVGFGKYKYEPTRARHLPAAMETLKAPDWIYRPLKLRSADRVFIKEFDELPFPYTIVLVGKRKPNILYPVTSFSHKRNSVGRWMNGELLYSKTTLAHQIKAGQ
jgi:hypothetical protein